MYNKKIIFLHLPKTGGSSLHNILKDNFKHNLICPERFDKLDQYPINELNQYKYFSGHYSWNSLSRINEPKYIITLFREPKDRILSLYYYWKSYTDEYTKKNKLIGPKIAKKNNIIGISKLRK